MHSIYSSATTQHATIRDHKLRERFHDNPPQGSQRSKKKAALVHRKRYTVVANRSPGRYLSNQNLCGIEVLRARAHTHFALPGSNAMIVVPFTRTFYMVRALSLCRKWFHKRRAVRPQNSHSSCSVVQFALFSSFGGKCTRIVCSHSNRILYMENYACIQNTSAYVQRSHFLRSLLCGKRVLCMW